MDKDLPLHREQVCSRLLELPVQSPRRPWPRRTFLLATIATGCSAASISAGKQPTVNEPDPNCPRCLGVGRLPAKDTKPLVWLKGTPQPKWDAAVGEQPCPICQPGLTPAAIAAEFKEAVLAGLEKNKQWEERTGWKLACIITRHAVVHTQLTTVQARMVGNALETMTIHLKRITDSLLMTPTRPDSFELIMLWEKASWEQFRKVMESLYTIQQLGESWYSAQSLGAYDHFEVPHVYDTPQTLRSRPPSCGAVFLAARRQLRVASDWKAPFWLYEGFGAYGDNVVHKLNRWYMVYAQTDVPVGDWLADAAKLANRSKLRPWPEMIQRELRDWTADDHIQTAAMAAFLFESAPATFLDFVRKLRRGEPEVPAFEAAYGTKLDELDAKFSRWLTARR
jgi:hypothetical protein